MLLIQEAYIKTTVIKERYAEGGRVNISKLDCLVVAKSNQLFDPGKASSEHRYKFNLRTILLREKNGSLLLWSSKFLNK